MSGVDYDFMKLYRENERIRLFPLFVKRIDAEISKKNRENGQRTVKAGKDEKEIRRKV